MEKKMENEMETTIMGYNILYPIIFCASHNPNLAVKNPNAPGMWTQNSHPHFSEAVHPES